MITTTESEARPRDKCIKLVIFLHKYINLHSTSWGESEHYTCTRPWIWHTEVLQDIYAAEPQWTFAGLIRISLTDRTRGTNKQIFMHLPETWRSLIVCFQSLALLVCSLHLGQGLRQAANHAGHSTAVGGGGGLNKCFWNRCFFVSLFKWIKIGHKDALLGLCVSLTVQTYTSMSSRVIHVKPSL